MYACVFHEQTHDSLAGIGIFALPLNCSVISFMLVDSVKKRATWPLRDVGSTSGPVPFSVRKGASRITSRCDLGIAFSVRPISPAAAGKKSSKEDGGEAVEKWEAFVEGII